MLQNLQHYYGRAKADPGADSTTNYKANARPDNAAITVAESTANRHTYFNAEPEPLGHTHVETLGHAHIKPLAHTYI